jgi:CO dehydrogenase maturation factor
MSKVIAITGKGGTGKTTTAALIIKWLKEHARGPILALDADPDANLATVLAVPIEKTIGDLREETVQEIKKLPVGMTKANYIQAGLHQIVVETPKVDFITMGRSEGPGCYCFVNALLREFAEDLEDSYEWVVMDNEAGLEHVSRRTTAHVDHLIVVVNSSPLAVDCARRIHEIVTSLKNDVKHMHVIFNDVSDDKIEVLKTKLEPLGFNFLGSLPHDDVVEEQVFSGKSLYELNDTPATCKMDEIMKKIVEEL